MSVALSSCRALLAVELVPEGAPTALTLPLESAHALGDLVARDLARLLPGVETTGLALAAALFDPAQVLRPGFRIHAELAHLHRQAQTGGWTPAVASFGASAGRMASSVLEPDPRLIGSPLLMLPFVLVGHEPDIAALDARMEAEFETTGMADSATALLLNQAFSIRTEHVRYLTLNDLLALTAMQYEHAGFAALWSVIECALLTPERDETVDLGGGVRLRHHGGRVMLDGDANALAHRQAVAILAAHGLIATTH